MAHTANYKPLQRAKESGVPHPIRAPFGAKGREKRNPCSTFRTEPHISVANEAFSVYGLVQTPLKLHRFVTASPNMLRLLKKVEKVAPLNLTVLITGPTGSGKELIARLLHSLSRRSNEPFVVIDCAALPETLVESELFGHVRGAFTGAERDKPGLLVEAAAGTIFLDEIGEMPLSGQMKLLRCLQEREVRPVGATWTVPFHARIVAATNADLVRQVKHRLFREDLYFRLNTVHLNLPSLDERRGDVLLLADAFARRYCAENNVRKTLGREASAYLQRRRWPGNVRELESVIYRACALSDEGTISAIDCGAPEEPNHKTAPASSLGILPLEQVEREAILNAITACGGHKIAAAEHLAIGKTTLYRKLKEYELRSDK
jgi:DNA-binding NtrC family response regulator